MSEIIYHVWLAALGALGHTVTTTVVWMAGRLLWLAITGTPATTDWFTTYFVSIPIMLLLLWAPAQEYEKHKDD